MSEPMQEILENILPKKKNPWKFVKIFGGIFLFLILAAGLMGGGAAWYLKTYQDKIYPGVYAGHYHLGGMSRDDLKNFIETLNNRLAKEGINLNATVNDKTKSIKINTVSAADNSTELVKLDSYVLWQGAYGYGRSGNDWQRLFDPLYLRFYNQNLAVPVKTDWISLLDILKDSLSPLVDAPQNARVKVSSFAPLAYQVIPEQSGMIFDYEGIIKQIQDNLSQLNFGNTTVSANRFEPSVKFADAQTATAGLAKILSYGNLGLNYVDSQTNARRDWSIAPAQFAQWLNVEKDDSSQPIFVLDKEQTKTYLESLRPLVDRIPKDAKFSISDDGKVKEFQASQTGLNFDVNKTFDDLNSAFKERNYHPTDSTKTVSLTVETVDPIIKTADVNNLGIEDIIGMGYSTFHDSHNNRIKNITRAVERLNGVLIKPDEEFSAIKYAGPFTAENGFLPEAIIKGTEIKNEIGGGMCQIGTTLFRMAMNSGMDITQRQNHSLVVGYYLDPVNHNPGTDAALYEPYLDLKFKNDTGHYLLLQTDIDFKKQQLTFTLWGKPDGRKGWFTHPDVKKWIPYGDKQEVPSDKLPVGQTKCQSPFKGAVASFTYTRIAPDGQKIDRVFDSYYRPLPEICMVGTGGATSTAPLVTEDSAPVPAGTTTP